MPATMSDTYPPPTGQPKEYLLFEVSAVKDLDQGGNSPRAGLRWDYGSGMSGR